MVLHLNSIPLAVNQTIDSSLFSACFVRLLNHMNETSRLLLKKVDSQEDRVLGSHYTLGMLIYIYTANRAQPLIYFCFLCCIFVCWLVLEFLVVVVVFVSYVSFNERDKGMSSSFPTVFLTTVLSILGVHLQV